MAGIEIKFDTSKENIIKGNSWVYTNSLNLANVLDYSHKEILKKIKKILKEYGIEDGKLKSLSSADPVLREFIQGNIIFNFEIDYYKNKQNKNQPFYKLSRDLAILVIFSYRKAVNAKQLQLLYMAEFNRMEKELNWLRARYLGIDVRNKLTDSIKEFIESPSTSDYVKFTDLIYITLFGKKAYEIRKSFKLKARTNIRPFLDKDCLMVVRNLEHEIGVLLSYGLGFDEIEKRTAKRGIKQIPVKLDKFKLKKHTERKSKKSI
nr:Rha family transcriptional regulator [Bacillus velezensis]